MPGLAHKLPQEISFVREVLSGATPTVGRSVTREEFALPVSLRRCRRRRRRRPA